MCFFLFVSVCVRAQIIGIGLCGVFELIKETRFSHPSLCLRSLQALLDMLQGQQPEGFQTEPPDVLGKADSVHKDYLVGRVIDSELPLCAHILYSHHSCDCREYWKAARFGSVSWSDWLLYCMFPQSLYSSSCWRPRSGARDQTTQRDRPSLPCPAPASSVLWCPGETLAKSCRLSLPFSPTMAAMPARQYR